MIDVGDDGNISDIVSHGIHVVILRLIVVAGSQTRPAGTSRELKPNLSNVRQPDHLRQTRDKQDTRSILHIQRFRADEVWLGCVTRSFDCRTF
jgi:hypothetical protein